MKNGLQLWAGSELSYQAYIEGLCKAQADTAFKADKNYDTEVLGQVLNVDGGIAIINISGSLVNGSAGYGVFYGYTGYNDIRNALASAISDPSVNSILLNISSGGGEVAGCQETAQLIARVNTIKPVVTYTGSSMASAALWLGSQARHSISAQTAVTGSLGIIRYTWTVLNN
jgi:capsid assembly protease